MTNTNTENKEPVIIAEHITKLFPLRSQRKRKKRESIFSYLRKEMSFSKKEDLFKALDDVSFMVYPGEAVGIVGSNGSGKSTLLRVLTGITQPSSGNVVIKGSYGELFSLNGPLNKDLTGRQNIYLYAALKGISKREIEEIMNEIINFSEIGRFIEEPVKTYSSGMRSRLGFSLIVHTMPKIMFIDEALSAGDASFSRKCDQKFAEYLQDHTKTMLIVSHSSNALKRICSRIIWLERGVIKMEGEVDEVLTAYAEYMSDFSLRKADRKVRRQEEKERRKRERKGSNKRKKMDESEKSGN